MSEASGSASPAPGSSAAELGPGGTRPKRAVRPTAKALQAREQSPDGWEHGGSRRSQPLRPIRTASGARPQIKLKMKASGGGTAAGSGQGLKTQAYMQSYDRELDSEDDETGQGLAFEEQLIFRMPEGPECDKLRDSIQKRQLGDDVWFKFKDSRRAIVHVGDSLFSAKLVDLPTITEAHKTLDNRQFFKVADIAQMLVVESKIADESQASSSAAGGGKGFNIEDFIYPHGITPPMQWARKRRFRKRAARRAIETVEKEVERLLKADKKADDVEYEMIDAAEEGVSEDDDDQQGGPSRRGATSPGGSQAETPMPDGSDGGSQDEDGDDGDDDDDDQARRRRTDTFDGGEGGYDEDLDDDVDEDLAAELDAALEEEEDDDDESTRGAGSEAQSRTSDQEDLWDDDDDDDADDGDEEDDDEEDENDEEKEQRVREAQLEAECRELETLVRRKQSDVDGTMNLIIKNRHQQALRKLTTERDMKRNQLADLKQTRKERKEANQAAAEAAEQAAAVSNLDDTEDAARLGDDLADERPHSGSTAGVSTSGAANIVENDAPSSTTQHRGMPPPALPASRNLSQPSTPAARPPISSSGSAQKNQADPDDSNLWEDEDEEDVSDS
ncbi:TAFII55 protein, conserved region [Kalmanozyma brasiliensis GHG001]|uniref:TAFII55 protein, conserved region n=1 Tax=Kalmanozyma brasiliensis (strain GHG001) TaxID=1365824 RepID=UPI002867F8D7|nr:TAFII55 protein, conserved region [Kalmanozyma brasiliensis GHG001]EST10146.2 TAFII55 protein, conserved region [Kalmanozyma brasiliensis GHG001]